MSRTRAARSLNFAFDGKKYAGAAVLIGSVDANVVATQSELTVTGRYLSDDLNRSLRVPVATKEYATFRFSIRNDGTVKFEIYHRHGLNGGPANGLQIGKIDDERLPEDWRAPKVSQAEIPEMLYEMLYEFDKKRDLSGQNMLLKQGPSLLAEEVRRSSLRPLDPYRLRDLLRATRTFGFNSSLFLRQSSHPGNAL